MCESLCCVDSILVWSWGMLRMYLSDFEKEVLKFGILKIIDDIGG